VTEGGPEPPSGFERLRRALGPVVLAAAAALLVWEAADRPAPPAAEAAPTAEEPARLQARLDRGIEGVRERFHALERTVLGQAEALAPRVLAAVPRPTDAPADRAALFEALAAALGEERPPLSGAAVVDREGRPLAWWGRIATGASQGPPAQETSTRVVRSRVYRMVRAEVPLAGPGGEFAGAVRTFAPFYASIPLHNRYLRRLDFEAEAEEALGLENVDLVFEPPADGHARPLPPLSLRAPLEGVLGQLHGTLEVQVRPIEESEARAQVERTRLRRGLLALALLLVVVLDALPVRRLPRGLPRAAARAGLVLALRAALLALGFPAEVLKGEACDPSTFSITALGGALGTPADALLTTAAALAAVLLLARAIPRPSRAPGAAARAAALAGAVLAAWGGGVAWIGLARAAAFQSRIDFFPEDRVLPPAASAALLLAVGGLFAAAAVPLLRLLSVAAGRRLHPRSTIASGLALAVASAAASAMTVQWQSLQALREDALLLVERTEPARESEERVALVNLLERLAAPDSPVRRLLRARNPRREDAAFYLWAGTPELHGRADGCALDVLDADGTLVSRFDIDVPPRSWLPEAPPPPAGGAVVERRAGRKGASERPFWVAAATIPGEDDATVGGIRVVLPAFPAAERPSRPEILRNYGGGRAPRTERFVHRAVFDGERLRESTNPEYPRGLRAPAAAVEAILGRGEPLLWLREEVAGTWYHNAYLPRTEPGAPAGILSVGFRSLSGPEVFLNLAKALFLHLLAAGALGLAGGAAALALGRARLPAFGFGAKVLAGFVLVGAGPVVGLALLERSLAEDRTHAAMEREVMDGLRRAESSLRDAGVLSDMAAVAPADGPPVPAEAIQARVPDDRVQDIAYRVGAPVNLFLGDALLASSERGIFATELFSPRVPAGAFLQVVLLGRGAYTARERFGSFPFLVGYAPVRDADGRTVGVLSVPLLFRQDQADRDLARTTTVALALYVLVLLAATGAAAILARRTARPVEALAEGTRRVAAGDLAFRIPRGPRDELGALVDSFNRMTEGLEAGREAAARAEREAAWREMAKQVAHEIKNPLTPMRLHAQHLLRAQEDGSPDAARIAAGAAETILRQTEALQRIASDFSSFARLPKRSPEPLDLAVLAREAADLYRGSEGVEIVLEAPDGLPRVHADREEMRVVLINLCGNAVEAMPKGGRLRIALRAEALPPAAVVLEVEDSGVGIPSADLPRLFDPNFSTKTRGTGLGLAIVRRAVEETGGRIAVRSEVGKGSTFTVTLPALPTVAE
jgi:signal transduction histidine kinase